MKRERKALATARYRSIDPSQQVSISLRREEKRPARRGAARVCRIAGTKSHFSSSDNSGFDRGAMMFRVVSMYDYWVTVAKLLLLSVMGDVKNQMDVSSK